MPQVNIQNKMNQSLQLPLRNEHGILENVKLDARKIYGPVEESQMTPYTRRLAANGRIRIRRA